MQGSDDEVKSYPNNKKPAGPIETVEHEHAGNNRGNPGDVYDPMCLEVGNACARVESRYGCKLATNPMLPNTINIQLITVIERGRLSMARKCRLTKHKNTKFKAQSTKFAIFGET